MYDKTKKSTYTREEVQAIIADVLEDEKNPLGLMIIMIWCMMIGIVIGWLI